MYKTPSSGIIKVAARLVFQIKILLPFTYNTFIFSPFSIMEIEGVLCKILSARTNFILFFTATKGHLRMDQFAL